MLSGSFSRDTLTFFATVLAKHRRLVRAILDHVPGLLAVTASHFLGTWAFCTSMPIK
jgi:hypothetical protein